VGEGCCRGPGGVFGRYGRVTQHTTYITRVAGINVLGRGAVDRVSVTGGIRVGIW
jgi:hypothetical protein